MHLASQHRCAPSVSRAFGIPSKKVGAALLVPCLEFNWAKLAYKAGVDKDTAQVTDQSTQPPPPPPPPPPVMACSATDSRITRYPTHEAICQLAHTAHRPPPTAPSHSSLTR